MDQHSPVVEFSANPAKEIQLTMRRMDRRQWWLWSYAIMVTLLLLVAVASFAFPALLSQEDSYYSFFLNQAVRGLAAHYRRSPGLLSEEEVRSYLLGLRAAVSAVSQGVSK